MVDVVVLEGAVVTLMEPYEDSHHLAQTHRAIALSRLQMMSEQLAVPDRFEGLAKVIDVAEEFL